MEKDGYTLINKDGVNLMEYTLWGIIDLVTFITGKIKKRYGTIYVERDNQGKGKTNAIRRIHYYCINKCLNLTAKIWDTDKEKSPSFYEWWINW